MDEDEDYTCDLTEEELFELTEGLLLNRAPARPCTPLCAPTRPNAPQRAPW